MKLLPLSLRAVIRLLPYTAEIVTSLAATVSFTQRVNAYAPVIYSGGGGAPPPPVIHTVTVEGFTSSVDLKTDSSGNVQAATQLSLEGSQTILDIARNTRLLDVAGKARSSLSSI